MKAKLLKTGLIVSTVVLMAGCATTSRVDSLESDMANMKTRMDQLEGTTSRTEAKVDRALEKIDRMSNMTYSK